MKKRLEIGNFFKKTLATSVLTIERLSKPKVSVLIFKTFFLMSELYFNFFRLQNLPLLTYSINFKSSKNEFKKMKLATMRYFCHSTNLTTRRLVVK